MQRTATMTNLSRDSLMTLERYAKERPQFRARVMEHKKNRTVHLGEHVALIFEDELTIRYQIQEMLRAERIFEQEGIQEEVDVYAPLIPDGSNWKATMMIQYPDIEERRRMLAQLIGVEDRVRVQVAGHGRVYAIADEDLERETAEKTSSVHFLRFELDSGMVSALKQGAVVEMGIDHPAYSVSADIAPAVRDSLVRDLKG
jgi:hypothetical protein